MAKATVEVEDDRPRLVTVCPACRTVRTAAASRSRGSRRNDYLEHAQRVHLKEMGDRARSLLADRMLADERPLVAQIVYG